MNQDVYGNRKLFWKEVGKVNGVKAESCSRIKDGNGRLALEEDGVRRIWKDYFEDLYNIYSRASCSSQLWLRWYSLVTTLED